MSLTIINENAPANGGYWKYTQPESGAHFESPYLDQLKSKVRAHRIAMSYPIGSNFDKEMESSLCARHPTSCHEINPFSPPDIVDQAVSFVSTFAVWAREGLPVVTRDKYLERRTICMGCDYWAGDRGLGFGRCGKCGCSALKLFLGSVACPIGKW